MSLTTVIFSLSTKDALSALSTTLHLKSRASNKECIHYDFVFWRLLSLWIYNKVSEFSRTTVAFCGKCFIVFSALISKNNRHKHPVVSLKWYKCWITLRVLTQERHCEAERIQEKTRRRSARQRETKTCFLSSSPAPSFLKMPRVGLWLVTRGVWRRAVRGVSGCYFKDKQLSCCCSGLNVVHMELIHMWTRCGRELNFIEVSLLAAWFILKKTIKNYSKASKESDIKFGCLICSTLNTCMGRPYSNVMG